MHHVIKCTPKSSLRTKGEDDDAWSPCHVVDVAQRGELQDTPPKMFASNALCVAWQGEEAAQLR
jgi:hypothetical protein